LTPIKTEPNLINPLTDDLSKMLREGLFSDLEILTKDNQTIKAHKNILAARSPKFFEILTADKKNDKIPSVVNAEFDSKTVMEVLNFIYCAKVDNLEAYSYSLIFAAERYQLDELKNICMLSIINRITPKNLLDCFLIAHHISGCDELFSRCIELCKA
jgi:BTB/POZ domain